MCAVWSLRSADRHCCVLLSCLKSVTIDFVSDCVRIFRYAIDFRHASEVQVRKANAKEGRVKEDELDRQGLAEPVGTFLAIHNCVYLVKVLYKKQNLLLVLLQLSRWWNSIICIFLQLENDLQCTAVSKSSKTSLAHLIADHQALLQSALLDTDTIFFAKNARDPLGSSYTSGVALPIPTLRLFMIYCMTDIRYIR